MMKTTKLLFVGSFFAVSAACGDTSSNKIVEIGNQTIKSTEKAKKTSDSHRLEVARTLSEATRVDLYLLKFDQSVGPRFINSPKAFKDVSGTSAIPIARSKTLNEDERKIMIKALQNELRREKPKVLNGFNGTMHGIRVFIGDRKIFDSSFSWGSMSFGFAYPGNYVRYEVTEQLKEVLYRILPPTKLEQERFDKQFGTE